MSDPLRADENQTEEEDYEGLFEQLTEVVHSEPTWKAKYTDRKISPRVRLAAKYYNSGIAKTLGEAARLAGLHPGTLYAMNISGNEEFNRISAQAAKNADIATGDISAVLQRLGRNALITIEELRAKSDSESIKLKAAIDLADRSPETSKVQKTASLGITLEGKDIAELTRSLVEAAKVQNEFIGVTTGDYVKVTTESVVPQHSLPIQHVEVINDPVQ